MIFKLSKINFFFLKNTKISIFQIPKKIDLKNYSNFYKNEIQIKT